MPAVIVELADAVVAAIAGQVFSMPLTASRKYVPHFDLKELDGVQVTVMPRSVAPTNATRGRAAHEVLVDVAVQRKVPYGTPADVDPLMQLVEEIADHLTRLGMPTVPASWVRMANEPIYAAEHMREKRLFTSVLTFTFLVHR